MVEIVAADTDELIETARTMFREYTEGLPFDLDFQDLDEELADPGIHYAPPMGRLFVAMVDTHPAGCVALRDFGKGVCEMKRLYVRPAFRGRGIGRRFVNTIIEEAREIGYDCMRLDTVPAMENANRLYRAMGFKPIEAYRFNPVDGAIYLKLKL